MQHLELSASVANVLRASSRGLAGGNLLLCMAVGLAMTSLPAAATTLYKCKLDGKTVFSDTECPREVRVKNQAKMAKPRVVKIRQSTASARTR